MKTTLATYQPIERGYVQRPDTTAAARQAQWFRQTLERIAHGAPDPVAEARRALGIE